MSSNAAKLSNISRKAPTHKCYLNRAGDKWPTTLSKQPPPHSDGPRENPKTKQQPFSRTTLTDHLILLPLLSAYAATITIVMMIFKKKTSL